MKTNIYSCVKKAASAVCLSVFFASQTHGYGLSSCKVDRFQLKEITVKKPSKALDSFGTSAISGLISTIATGGLSKIASGLGYGFSATSTAGKIYNYQFQGVAVTQKTLAVSKALAGKLVDNKIYIDPIGYGLESAISAIDDSIDTADDLIVRIGGVKVLLHSNSGLDFLPMSINQTYPTSFGLTDNISVSFLGAANVQLIEWDSGSKNDNMGDVSFFHVPADQCLYNLVFPNSEENCNADTATVLSATSGDAENGAIYELKYEILPGAGDINEIPERLLCNSSECFDANKPLAYQYDFTFPPNKPCPVGYDEGAGFYHVDDPTGTFKTAYRVCELIPHYPTPATKVQCGATYYDTAGFNIDISQVYEVYGFSTVNVTLKSNGLSYYDTNNDSAYLSAQDGQYLGRCDGCAEPNNPAIHVIDPNRKVANWSLKKLGNGKYTLRADNNLYLTYSAKANRALLQDTQQSNPLAQFTLENVDTGYLISTESNGVKRYLAACLDCSSNNKAGYRYAAGFHTTDPNSPYAVWEINWSSPSYTNLNTLANAEGVINTDMVISPNERWIVSSGDKIILNPNTTLTIEDGGILQVQGTFENEGRVDVFGSGRINNSGKIINNMNMVLRNQANFTNDGTIINEGNIYIYDYVVLANTISGRILNNKNIRILGGALKNMGIIDNSLAEIFENNSKIYSSINNNTRTDYAQIFDPKSMYSGTGSNTNSIINGYFIGRAIGEQSCSLLGGNYSGNTCTLDDYRLPYDKTLIVEGNLQLTGTLKNQGFIINNGNIINTEGNINQCGFIDEDGSTNRGTLVNPLQACTETVDEELCSQYYGQFEFKQPTANNTCRINANNSFTGVYDPLIIRSGVTWMLEGLLQNFSVIHIEPNAKLIVNGGMIEHFSSYAISNLGEISLEKSPTSNQWGTIRNYGIINNPGVINNAGDLVGTGSVQNLCDGIVNVLPDWDTRRGTNADHQYDMSGESHAILVDVCYPLDTDGDGVPDNNDAFAYDNRESADSDGDGVGDNADAFPNSPSETTDTDGDAVGDNADAFPFDPNETHDTDGDGIGDNADIFPYDPSETIDSDADGVGDNSDYYPNDPAESADSDWDGVGDNADAFPNDRLDIRLISVVSNNEWVLKDARFVLPRGEVPWKTPTDALHFPQDALEFKLNGGELGSSVELRLTYPRNFAPDVKWWTSIRYGDWEFYNYAIINKNIITLTMQDGGFGDADGLANGIIVGGLNVLNIGGPAFIDTDQDGMSDSYEENYNLDTANNDAGLDLDSDSLSNLQEFQIGTNPNLADTDDDGVADNIDIFPLDKSESVDTDLDGFGNNADTDDDNDSVDDSADAFPLDASESLDTDGDSIGNNADTDDDGDGYTDADELAAGSDPLSNSSLPLDTDGDFISNVTDTDDDGDGFSDIEELEMDTDPLDADHCFTCGPQSWWRFKLMQPTL